MLVIEIAQCESFMSWFVKCHSKYQFYAMLLILNQLNCVFLIYLFMAFCSW
jgi:hypothetical protein